jgi:UDP-N-acetylmuramoyl-tripeptide--D-alanyl-D-alanine ligase
MSFRLGDLRRWLSEGDVVHRVRRADGSTEVQSIDELRCRSAVTDSRQVEDGFLFCAVQGDDLHGATFLPDALAAGAVAALVEGRADTVEGSAAPVIEVEDARRALAVAARGWLDQHGPRVIGITGSNGKTTTKDFLGAALGGELSVSVSPGNLNSLWGLPLAVLGFRGDEEWLVLEMGASVPDEIGRLAEIARPWMGCVTNIAPAHLEGFGSVEEVVRTKAQLLEALPPNGVAVINADDSRCETLRAKSGADRVILFGRDARADVRIEEAIPSHGGVRVRIDGQSAELPVFGEMNASNAAAAIAMARFCGVPTDRALERISRARLSPHRSRTCECGGRTIVDDSYNDHALHRGLDLVVVCGPLFAQAAPAGSAAGLEVIESVDVDAILLCLEKNTQAGDLVLLKGSRTAGLERVLAAVSAHWSGVISNGEQMP